jgi:hypothetical protein
MVSVMLMAAGDADPARVPCAGVGVGSVVSAGYVVSVPERLVPDSARVPDSTSGISSLVQTLIAPEGRTREYTVAAPSLVVPVQAPARVEVVCWRVKMPEPPIWPLSANRTAVVVVAPGRR